MGDTNPHHLDFRRPIIDFEVNKQHIVWYHIKPEFSKQCYWNKETCSLIDIADYRIFKFFLCSNFCQEQPLKSLKHMVFQFLFNVKKFPYLIAGTSSFQFLQQIWKEGWIYQNKQIEMVATWTNTRFFFSNPPIINWKKVNRKLKMPAFKNLKHLTQCTLGRITEHVYPTGMRFLSHALMGDEVYGVVKPNGMSNEYRVESHDYYNITQQLAPDGSMLICTDCGGCIIRLYNFQNNDNDKQQICPNDTCPKCSKSINNLCFLCTWCDKIHCLERGGTY